MIPIRGVWWKALKWCVGSIVVLLGLLVVLRTAGPDARRENLGLERGLIVACLLLGAGAVVAIVLGVLSLWNPQTSSEKARVSISHRSVHWPEEKALLIGGVQQTLKVHVGAIEITNTSSRALALDFVLKFTLKTNPPCLCTEKVYAVNVIGSGNVQHTPFRVAAETAVRVAFSIHTVYQNANDLVDDASICVTILDALSGKRLTLRPPDSGCIEFPPRNTEA